MPTVTTTYVIGNGNNGAGANQILSETTSGVTTAYAYDGNGNRTGRTIGSNTDVYSYDYENRLTGFDDLTGSSGTGMYTYTYDYRTRRVSRTEPSAGTTYIVFDGGTSIEEYTSTPSSPTVEYIRGFNYGGGVGGLEYSIRSGTPSFNFYDSRGDVTTKTSSAGAVTWETAYEAFGNQTVSTGTTPLDRQRASTKEQDPTGLLNEGFRYRDPSTGTFLTRDPLGFKAGLNNYTYVHQNPWTKFDPEGLAAFPTDVMHHVNAVGSMLTIPSSDTIGRQAAMNVVGEENLSNHGKGRVMSAVHQMHDKGASTGLSSLFRVIDPIPGLIIPESWSRGNILEKAIAQFSPILHDIGPANTKLKTAGEVMGAKNALEMALVAKMLTTDGGTAIVLSHIVQNAQKDLNPLISARTNTDQVQLITDYVRQGSQHFWDRVESARQMTPAQLDAWRQHPDTFRMPDGSKPAPLIPSPIDPQQMKQVKDAEKKTRNDSTLPPVKSNPIQ